jgi:hypothetical protein
VQETSLADWDRLISYVKRSGLPFRLAGNDAEIELPDDAGEIFQMHETLLPTLKIDPDGLRINCHFLGVDEIEMDFDVRDFETRERIDALSSFIAGLGRHLDKPVIVTYENSPHLSIWRYLPSDDTWRHWSDQDLG